MKELSLIMKKVISLIMVCVLSISFVGCGNNEESDKKINKKVEGIYIPKEWEFNAIINDNCMLNGFKIPIISEKKLEINDLKIDIQVSSPFECTLTEVKTEELPYYVFQSYKRTDWSKMNELASDDTKNVEFTKYQDKYLEEYNKIEKVFDFHYYNLSINFDINNLCDEDIKEIIIKYDNKEYRCVLKGLEITTGMEYSKEINDRKEFYMSSVGMCDNYIVPNKNGKLEITDLEYIAEEDVVIKSVSIYGNDYITIDEILFSNDSINTDMKFKEGMKLLKGDKGKISLKLNDKKFKSKLFYYNNMFLDIEVEANNKTKHELVFIQANTKYDPYEVYAYIVDGVDILPYYTEFYVNYME